MCASPSYCSVSSRVLGLREAVGNWARHFVESKAVALRLGIPLRSLLLGVLVTMQFSTCVSFAQYLDWKQASNPLHSVARQIFVGDDFVYALCGADVYRSHLNAGGWRNCTRTTASQSISCMCVQDALLTVAYADGHLAQTTNGGTSWTTKQSPQLLNPKALLRLSDTLFLVDATNTLWRSLWSQPEWSPVHSTHDIIPSTVVVSGNEVYAIADSVLLRVGPSDTLWRSIATLPTDLRTGLHDLAVHGSVVLLSCDSGLQRSTDLGQNWNRLKSLEEGSSSAVHLRSDHGILCCVSGARTQDEPGVVYRSNDWGYEWYQVSSFKGRPLSAQGYQNEVVLLCDNAHIIDVKPIIHDAIDLCAGPNSGFVAMCAAHKDVDWVVCDDEAMVRMQDWSVWFPVTRPPVPMNDIVYFQNRLVGCGLGSSLVQSDDMGLSWFELPTDLPADQQYTDMQIVGDRAYLAARTAGVFESTDGMASWKRLSNLSSMRCWSVRDTHIAVISSDASTICTVDLGSTTTQCQALTLPSVCSVTHDFLGNVLLIDSSATHLMRSTDQGAHWEEIQSHGLPASARKLVGWHEDLYLLSASQGLFRSTDQGLNWTAQNLHLRDSVLTLIRFRDSTILVGTASRGLYYASESKLATTDLTQETLNISADLRIWPQPASDYLNLQTGLSDIILRLYNLQGSCVLTKSTGASSGLELSSLASGIYVLEVQSGGESRRRLVQVLH